MCTFVTGHTGAGAGLYWGWCRTLLGLVQDFTGAGAGPYWGWCRTILGQGQDYTGAGAGPHWGWGRTILGQDYTGAGAGLYCPHWGWGRTILFTLGQDFQPDTEEIYECLTESFKSGFLFPLNWCTTTLSSTVSAARTCGGLQHCL